MSNKTRFKSMMSISLSKQIHQVDEWNPAPADKTKIQSPGSVSENVKEMSYYRYRA